MTILTIYIIGYLISFLGFLIFMGYLLATEGDEITTSGFAGMIFNSLIFSLLSWILIIIVLSAIVIRYFTKEI